MAKKRKVHKRSLEKSVWGVYGMKEYVDKIESMIGDVHEPLERMYKYAVKPSIDDIERFMINHQRSGRTYKSFNRGTTRWDENKTFLEFRFGFDIEKGGYPALFLEYGTPKTKPYFFMHHAIKDHEHELNGLMDDCLKEILKEKGLM